MVAACLGRGVTAAKLGESSWKLPTARYEFAIGVCVLPPKLLDSYTLPSSSRSCGMSKSSKNPKPRGMTEYLFHSACDP